MVHGRQRNVTPSLFAIEQHEVRFQLHCLLCVLVEQLELDQLRQVLVVFEVLKHVLCFQLPVVICLLGLHLLYQIVACPLGKLLVSAGELLKGAEVQTVLVQPDRRFLLSSLGSSVSVIELVNVFTTSC